MNQSKVYVANSVDNTVSIINSSSNANNTIGAIKVGNDPTAITVDYFDGKVYVANFGDNTVSIIDSAGNANKTIGTINVGRPTAIGVALSQHKVYVVSRTN